MDRCRGERSDSEPKNKARNLTYVAASESSLYKKGGDEYNKPCNCKVKF